MVSRPAASVRERWTLGRSGVGSMDDGSTWWYVTSTPVAAGAKYSLSGLWDLPSRGRHNAQLPHRRTGCMEIERLGVHESVERVFPPGQLRDELRDDPGVDPAVVV